MTASYPVAALSVNPLSSVSTGAASLYRWVHRWHGDCSNVHPHTRYIASKLGRSERTIYRWLAELTSVQAVACEVKQGVSRRILPCVDPLPVKQPRRSVSRASSTGKCSGHAREAALSQNLLVNGEEGARHSEDVRLYETLSAPMSGVVSGVVSGVLPVYALDACDTTTNNGPLVALLVQEGITATTAAALVAEHGERECLGQVEALSFRKASDRASVLVASIRGRWAMPAGLNRQRDRQRTDARKAAKDTAAAILTAHREKVRQTLETAFLGLSEAESEALKHRAEVQYRRAHPSMAGRVLSLGVAARLLRGEMLRLLAVERGLEYVSS